MEAALRGQGVALCCTVAAASAVARGELVSPVPLSASTERRVWAAWKSAQREPATRVLQWLLAELEARRTVHVNLVGDTPTPVVARRRDSPPQTEANTSWLPAEGPMRRVTTINELSASM